MRRKMVGGGRPLLQSVFFGSENRSVPVKIGRFCHYFHVWYWQLASKLLVWTRLALHAYAVALNRGAICGIMQSSCRVPTSSSSSSRRKSWNKTSGPLAWTKELSHVSELSVDSNDGSLHSTVACGGSNWRLWVGLFHDLLSAPMFRSPQCLVITAHKLTPAKRDVTTVVSNQRSRFIGQSEAFPLITDDGSHVTLGWSEFMGGYNTPNTVAKHRRRK